MISPAAPRAGGAALLARAVLVALGVACVAALFYAQVLKRQAPLVNGHGGVTVFRPGGPGVTQAHFHLKLSVGDVVDVVVLNPAGNRALKVIARNRRVREYRKFELAWDGTTAGGGSARPGRYPVEVILAHAGRTVVVPGLALVVEARPR